jgi:crotonobetainyl-CoA:carnitine CoA-transferase CaiB-like acyl-CoA transferase
MSGPLEGIKVVDASAVVSGPLATMMLADQGADVVRIEPPGDGDLLRLGAFRRGGLTAFFANNNRGKRSIAIDLMTDEGVEIVHRLVRDADVFVQNWRPGAAERLGLGEPALREVNPELVYCSISGYGDTGPYRDRRVYDPIIQSLTGHVAVQLNPEFPMRDLVRNVVSDKSSAYTAAQAITAALFARERGAGGQHVRVPMLDASLAFFWPDGMMRQTFVGEDVKRPGPTLYEMYHLTETADGHMMYFVASEVEHHGLYRALDHPEWCTDERFGRLADVVRPENRAALGELLLPEFAARSTAELVERLSAAGVPAAPVLDLEEIFEDPQILHNEAVYERDHPTAGRMRGARPAARFDKTPQQAGRTAPLHGEHTDEILGELGYDAAACARLRGAGVIDGVES